MEDSYHYLMNRISQNLPVAKEDLKFIKAYQSLLKAESGSKGAGNAGKRKQKRTGK
jgi:hypothetical protein